MIAAIVIGVIVIALVVSGLGIGILAFTKFLDCVTGENDTLDSKH